MFGNDMFPFGKILVLGDETVCFGIHMCRILFFLYLTDSFFGGTKFQPEMIHSSPYARFAAHTVDTDRTDRWCGM